MHVKVEQSNDCPTLGIVVTQASKGKPDFKIRIFLYCSEITKITRDLYKVLQSIKCLLDRFKREYNYLHV